MKNTLHAILCLTLASCAATPQSARPARAQSPQGDPPASTSGTWDPLRPGASLVQPPARPSARKPAIPAAPAPLATRADYRDRSLPRLSVENESSLREVMEYLEAVAGVDIFVWQEAEEAVEDEGIIFDIRIDRRITLVNALNLVCELAGDEISWRFKDGLIQVGPARQLRGPSKTYVYDVSDLTRSLKNFPGRDLNVSPSGGWTEPDEEITERAPILEESTLEDLIRSTILPDTWDEDDVDIRVTGGKVIIRHYR